MEKRRSQNRGEASDVTHSCDGNVLKAPELEVIMVHML